MSTEGNMWLTKYQPVYRKITYLFNIMQKVTQFKCFASRIPQHVYTLFFVPEASALKFNFHEGKVSYKTYSWTHGIECLSEHHFKE